MLLTPKRRKFRKEHVKQISGIASNGYAVSFGEYGLKALDNGFISNRQVESARKVITRYIRKVGKIWIRVFPRVPITSHGMEMPMGKGKGDVAYYACRIRKGTVLFEIGGVPFEIAKSTLLKASKKLSVGTEFVWTGLVK
ncbi:MAG: 50S ribosomal protein L16 [Candidatus Absconditabacterales bacterium]|nr:50S ribosomal protein L16 [Candidatus Absconditabacterales bacterium]